MTIRDLKAQREDMRTRYRAAVAERSRAETTPERRIELRPVIARLGKALTAIKKEIEARRKTDVLNAENRWRARKNEADRSLASIRRSGVKA